MRRQRIRCFVLSLGIGTAICVCVALVLGGYVETWYYLLKYEGSSGLEEKIAAVRQLLPLSPSLGVRRACDVILLLNSDFLGLGGREAGGFPEESEAVCLSLFRFCDKVVEVELFDEDCVERICSGLDTLKDPYAAGCICILSCLRERFDCVESFLGKLLVDGRTPLVREMASRAIRREPVRTRGGVDAVLRAFVKGKKVVCVGLFEALPSSVGCAEDSVGALSRESEIGKYVVAQLLRTAELDAECCMELLFMLRALCPGNEKAMKWILGASGSGSADVRWDVAHWLEDILKDDPAPSVRVSIIAVLRHLAGDADSRVRNRAMFALSGGGEGDAPEGR
jgi:hypothetical protein